MADERLNQAARSTAAGHWVAISIVSLLGGALLMSGCDVTREMEDAERSPPVASVLAFASPSPEGGRWPRLARDDGGVLMSWLDPVGDDRFALRISRLAGDEWTAVGTVAEGDDWFVNWADFPAVFSPDGEVLYAHWLQRGGKGTYDYGIRVSRSSDGGVTWSEPWTPHEDGTATEHGFVSFFPMEGGAGLAWLDGREFVDANGEPAETTHMTLRARHVDLDGIAGPEILLDDWICDCCNTSAAHTASGPIVAYRDRTPDEIRDTYVVAWSDGVWSEPVRVHEDGWHMPACPVNGPAIAAEGEHVVVAWFTAPDGAARVLTAFSDDGGRTFGPPVRVDDGNPVGRVDVMVLDDGAALVSWIEGGGTDAGVRIRRVREGNEPGPAAMIGVSGAGRGSGFPRMVPLEDGRVLLAWTDASQGKGIRVAVGDINDR